MNIILYGHANTIVFTYTKNGKFHKSAMLGGIALPIRSIRIALENAEEGVSLGVGMAHPDSNLYRRDYYDVRKMMGTDNVPYHGISRYLGYEEGETEGNIVKEVFGNPDVPSDLLLVWDEGHGGLDIPDSRFAIWASDKALPDPEQFEKVAKNCFLFLDANVLRKAGAFISRQISWERTATELIYEIQNNPSINYLLKARRLLITFGFDGAAFIIPNEKSSKPEASLILVHGDAEGSINNRRPSQFSNAFMFVAMTTNLATTIRSIFMAPGMDIMLAQSKDIFGTALEAALNFMEMGHFESMGETVLKLMDQVPTDAAKVGSFLRFVIESAEVITKHIELDDGESVDGGAPPSKNISIEPRSWPAFYIPIEGSEKSLPHDWTIISNVGNREIYDVAFEYVQYGAVAIEGLPQFSLGAFTTVDRWEIESYQNIANLILQYANTESTRPLSISVFGSPGSGKSFGVTQIAKNILPGKVEKLEFNVSQFLSMADLAAAFQKVRDVILEGKLPLVFFDEFDSDREGMALGWLKSFLMPMQDGRFKDDSGEHPVGKCILVFAGGTAPNFEEFIAPMTSEDKETRQDFKNVKGPDFVSRLKGTINVLGPNPKNDDDKNYILRRALLLRGLCERKLTMQNGKAPISPSVIHAMLQVPEYKHGARSMEAIMDMSRIDDGIFEPAALPFHTQLELHVDADAFLELVMRSNNKMEEMH
ncbi:MAG: AAA family ATPase [Defluviitaleaceae bacterium]|nr:AAA family ATPase [Defluviitaleaceae bacterium]